ncbi:ABC transporter ATP-binding protein [Prescottella agglutinans]|uniref:ABC-2 type transport system ATP-binding protein n=1 Tax=Prescottella agglutinans TaxID=1644129 RepID=A0ABT6MEF9_9NOCA|nr:ABC transporter ATP-binding protein [Prescottella agglutinans]MDH6281769.1 ABC-2 type transport system ATP-binding protein [Prescottella agglutinans]
MTTIDIDPKPIVSVDRLGKRFGDFTALDDVSFDLEPGKIYGLLGRNGAGKTTLMKILTGQETASSGTANVFGGSPFENADVLRNLCFVKESQKYPEDMKVKHVLAAAELLLPGWDRDFAGRLMDDFRLPDRRRVKKLSRGMTSALGIVIGLASRAPLTLFDEPYLGLDAVARQLFYDRLIADYAEHPRTIVLSTHLIDEVSNLLEHVVVIDGGRVVVDEDVDSLLGRHATVGGPSAAVDTFVAHRTVLHREALGGHSRATIQGLLTGPDREDAMRLGLELSPVSLQQITIRNTVGGEAHRLEEARP